MKPPHLTIARNNIFLGVWEETLRDTCFTNSCGSPLHFISNLINELYPENSVFSLWNENAKDFGLILSANNTLWENIVLNCWGTCCYDHTNEDEYFSSDIKAGDMFLIEHQNLPSDYIPRISPHLYIGDGYFFNWNMAEQEPIENIKKSIMGAKLKWVLRYNFDRTDTKTPSGAEDILTWENFWGESYVSMNNLSYDKNHRDTSQRELVASIDINGNITTDISPVPTLSDFFKIFLLKDCLVCFKEFDSVENEYTKNEEFLKSYPSTAGEGYYRYNWTLEFDASKYTDMENYLNTNNLQYMVI